MNPVGSLLCYLQPPQLISAAVDPSSLVSGFPPFISIQAAFKADVNTCGGEKKKHDS